MKTGLLNWLFENVFHNSCKNSFNPDAADFYFRHLRFDRQFFKLSEVMTNLHSNLKHTHKEHYEVCIKTKGKIWNLATHVMLRWSSIL